MSERQDESPASKVMSEAIELAIAEESPYPEEAVFVNADMPYTDCEIDRAGRKGYSVVLVSPGGEIQIIASEEILGEEPALDASAALSPAPPPGR